MFRSKDRSSSSSNSNSASHDDSGSAFFPNPGINNLGNSCYLNSVVQGLAASRPLRDALAAYPGAEKALEASNAGKPAAAASNDAENVGGEINAEKELDNEQNNIHAPPLGTPTVETSPSLQLLTEDPFPTNLPLSSALASTLVKIWSGKQSTISIKSLMRALNRKNEDWNEWDQMDAHELLRFLLDGVSMEELDLIKKIRPPPQPKKVKRKKGSRTAGPPIAEQLRRQAAGAPPIAKAPSSDEEDSTSDEDDLSSSEAESLLSEDPTYRLPTKPPPAPRYMPFIDTIFGGRFASVIVCEECRGVNRIEEDFLDISLPIKGDDGKVRKRDRLRKFLGSSSSDLKEEAARPKLAPRAPTAILQVSETEASESESAIERMSRSERLPSNASISSGGDGVNPGSQAVPSLAQQSRESITASSVENDGTEMDSRSRRRQSLDPSVLRRPSMKKAFLGMSGKDNDKVKARSRDPSPLSRGGSIRTRTASDANTLASKDSKSREQLSGTTAGKRASRRSTLLAKPSREQQEYIRKLFAEIPSPNSHNPLQHLRIAQPGGHHPHQPTAAEANGSPLALADATTTGLYTCLMQFTSVELLEDDNALQCRRCWKLLHPEMVAQIGRKRAAKLVRKKEEAENLRLQQLQKDESASGDISAATMLDRTSARHALNDNTPRASVSAGSDHAYSRAGIHENAILMNRKLVAERERQLSTQTVGVRGDSSASSLSNGPGNTQQNCGPEITVTANSPPVSPPAAAAGEVPPVSAFAQLGLNGNNTAATSGQANDAGSLKSVSSLGSDATGGRLTGAGKGQRATSSPSDLGAEADEEDRSEVSDVEPGHSSSRDQSRPTTANTSGGSSGISNQVKSLQMSKGTSSPATGPPGLLATPTLPPRSQRFIPRRAHKRYLISSLPSIMVLHLKRFQQNNKASMFSSFGSLKKIDDKVTFPLYLDMAPFLAPPPPAKNPHEQSAMEKVLDAKSGDESEASSSAAKGGRGRHPHQHHKEHGHHHSSWFRRPSPSAEMRSNSLYRLYAIISHKGNMSSGHYIAYVYTSQKRIEGSSINKTSGSDGGSITKSDHDASRQWIYCSDHIVKPASVDEVLKSQAYCLLYERVDQSQTPKL